MLTEILLSIMALIAVHCFLNSRSLKKLPPGPSPIFPILGNIPQLIQYRTTTPSEAMDKLAKLYGPVVYFKFGKLTQVMVQDLELAKEVLSSDVWADRFWDELVGERSWGMPLGIVVTWGDIWKEMRRFSIRTLRDFGFGKQQSMESVLQEEINLVISSLDEFARAGKELSMQQFFTVSILNILWSMLAGFRFSHDDAKLKQLVNLLGQTSKNFPMKTGIVQAFPFLWRFIKYSKTFRDRRAFVLALQNFFRDIIDERRKSGSYKEGTPADFIDAFLQEIDSHKNKNQPNFYTDEQFIMVCFDLFIAGADTTTNTLEFAMLYMVLNPKVQYKVQNEIDLIVGKDKTVTLQDKSRMPYTEATLMEIQRMANIVPVFVRGSNQDTTIAGYNIPKGTLLSISLLNLHHSKTTWSDPETFRPERFLDAEHKIVNADKLLPFGLGKRVCLGESLARASLFMYFASVLQRFTLASSPTRPTPSAVPINGFTFSPQEYFVLLSRRHHTA